MVVFGMIKKTTNPSFFNGLKITIFALFFLSGFCGILYQVVWLRKAFASFGIITPVISLVVSTFMLGLALGSWLGGRWIKHFRTKTGYSPILLYACAELTIGFGAFAVPYLFRLGDTFLLSAGQSSSASYLLQSALVICVTLLPWCFMMGTTFPFIMGFWREAIDNNSASFSFLYLANVIGAMIGAILPAFVLIELFGFSNTLMIAAIINFLIAGISFYLAYYYHGLSALEAGEHRTSACSKEEPARKEGAPVFLVLFMTGFCSMALEVIWTRAFTPVLGTTIYAFAFLLMLYLLATWMGSLFYRWYLKINRVISSEILLALCILTSIFSLLFNDPRMNDVESLRFHSRFLNMVFRLNFLILIIGIIGSVVPFCTVLGYLTPSLIDAYSRGLPDKAGRVYAINILGCILGPLFAGYLLLPYLGVKSSLLLFSLVFVLLFFVYGKMRGSFSAVNLMSSAVGVFLIIIGARYFTTYEDFLSLQKNTIVRRDHTATVVATGEGLKKRLLVNGIGITAMTPIVKIMTHMPLVFLDEPPKNGLVVCFGMGTTFRSLLSWDVKATAVELSPSVKDLFGFFYDDAETILKNPRAQVIIDDGRRFLRRTDEKFDLITIDPPPPIETAGSGLLYSKEFLELVRSHLNDGGILQHWLPAAGEAPVVSAVLRPITSVFPYVKVFRSIEGYGFHFIASSKPLKIPSVQEAIERMPETAQKDLMEWFPNTNLEKVIGSMFNNEIPIERILKIKRNVVVSDDQPYNEYFFLHQLGFR